MKKTRSLKMIRKIAVMALVLALGFPSYASETPDESDVPEIQNEIDNQQQELDKTQTEIEENAEKKQKLQKAKAAMAN